MLIYLLLDSGPRIQYIASRGWRADHWCVGVVTRLRREALWRHCPSATRVWSELEVAALLTKFEPSVHHRPTRQPAIGESSRGILPVITRTSAASYCSRAIESPAHHFELLAASQPRS